MTGVLQRQEEKRAETFFFLSGVVTFRQGGDRSSSRPPSVSHAAVSSVITKHEMSRAAVVALTLI